MAIHAEATENACINHRHPLVKGIILPLLSSNLQKCEIGHKLVSTNRKLHTGFRLVLKSMTLNDLERCTDLRCSLSLR